jgi:hypothetical protein
MKAKRKRATGAGLKTPPELAQWMETHRARPDTDRPVVPEADQPLLIERNPAEGIAPRRNFRRPRRRSKGLA